MLINAHSTSGRVVGTVHRNMVTKPGQRCITYTDFNPGTKVQTTKKTADKNTAARKRV